MNTSRIFTSLCAFAAIILASVSCSKEGNRLFEGYYSYKLSGTLEVERVYAGDAAVAADTLTFRIPDESGQMHILNMEGGKLLITMNAFIGSVSKMEATVSESTMNISSSSRQQRAYSGTESVEFGAFVSGEARKYDGVLVFDLIFTGSSEGLVYNYRILSSDVNCVASENE